MREEEKHVKYRKYLMITGLTFLGLLIAKYSFNATTLVKKALAEVDNGSALKAGLRALGKSAEGACSAKGALLMRTGMSPFEVLKILSWRVMLGSQFSGPSKAMLAGAAGGALVGKGVLAISDLHRFYHNRLHRRGEVGAYVPPQGYVNFKLRMRLLSLTLGTLFAGADLMDRRFIPHCLVTVVPWLLMGMGSGDIIYMASIKVYEKLPRVRRALYEFDRIVEFRTKLLSNIRQEFEQGQALCYEPPSNTPPSYICPITHLIINDPVQLPDSHYYERWAIQQWYDTGSTRCPNDLTIRFTNPRNLPTDDSLQKQIRRFIDRESLVPIGEPASLSHTHL